MTYLAEFDGFPGFEIIGVEKEFNSMIAGEQFVGIIDLLLRDKKTDEIVIVDFKSCSLASFKKIEIICTDNFCCTASTSLIFLAVHQQSSGSSS